MSNSELLQQAYEATFDASVFLSFAIHGGYSRTAMEGVSKRLSVASCAVQELCNRAAGYTPPSNILPNVDEFSKLS